MKAYYIISRNVVSIFCLFIACCLPSCVNERICPDPVYQQKFATIQDTAYPSDKIIGAWMQVGGNKFTESRDYLLLKRDGTGTRRIVLIRAGQDQRLVSEASIMWQYLGKNRWKIAFFGEHVVSNPVWANATVSGNNITTIVRFKDNRLYPQECPNTYVRADVDEVQQQLHSIRSLFR